MQFTQRLQCSPFLVMTYFLLRDYNILPKEELLWSLWVCTRCLGTWALEDCHQGCGEHPPRRVQVPFWSTPSEPKVRI